MKRSQWNAYEILRRRVNVCTLSHGIASIQIAYNLERFHGLMIDRSGSKIPAEVLGSPMKEILHFPTDLGVFLFFCVLT